MQVLRLTGISRSLSATANTVGNNATIHLTNIGAVAQVTQVYLYANGASTGVANTTLYVGNTNPVIIRKGQLRRTGGCGERLRNSSSLLHGKLLVTSKSEAEAKLQAAINSMRDALSQATTVRMSFRTRMRPMPRWTMRSPWVL